LAQSTEDSFIMKATIASLNSRLFEFQQKLDLGRLKSISLYKTSFNVSSLLDSLEGCVNLETLRLKGGFERQLFEKS